MPAHAKPTPIRHCQTCGTKLERKRLPNGDLEYLIHFNRRKYCDLKCYANRTIQHKENPCWMTAHYHARKICPPTPCEKCGSEHRTDVHHKDMNWKNNAQDNLQRLCRSCHIKAHRSESDG